MTTTKLYIRVYGDPCLRKKSSPVKEIGPGERMLIQSMIETLHAIKGIGLAAPQVGINQRIFVADIGDGPLAIINPTIIKKAGAAVAEEGCLSIPGVTVQIKRPEKIFIKFKDENNREVERSFDTLMARVISHETDHLDGKLIIDYASREEKKKFRDQLRELEAKTKTQK